MDSLTLIAFVHVLIAVVLIVFVLLQDSKGGAMGAFGGGSSGGNSVFGATGAGSFLVKATTWAAIIFAITCITLTYKTTHKGESVLDDFVPAASAPVKADSMTAPQEGEKKQDKATDK